ncbi:hypothetical protein BDF19DRAFT_72827 [Syncephalis fuscata]|nr:hypothetical protein BDF19DRAFT_72827 [Syncephalis fuscata]
MLQKQAHTHTHTHLYGERMSACHYSPLVPMTLMHADMCLLCVPVMCQVFIMAFFHVCIHVPPHGPNKMSYYTNDDNDSMMPLDSTWRHCAMPADVIMPFVKLSFQLKN